MFRIGWLQIFWAAFSWPLAASAVEVMYARSNGDWMERERPGSFSALNILDDDRATVWCSAGTGQGAEIEVVFSERAFIEKMNLATGNQSSTEAYQDFGRLRKLKLFEGDMTHEVELEDKPGYQTLRFDPTLVTDRLVLKLQAGYRGKNRRHSCITDVVFYKGSLPLNGKHLGAYIRSRLKALGFIDTWVAGPESSRDHELVFGVSGSYRFLYIPNDPQETALHKLGTWRLRGGDPELKVGNKWVPVAVKRDDAGLVIKLKIDEVKMDGIYTRRRQPKAW